MFIITPACSESLDFYQNKFVLYEIIGQPGKLVQTFGRIQRENSVHHDLSIYFLVANNTIELYFYMRLYVFVQASPYDDLKQNLKIYS